MLRFFIGLLFGVVLTLEGLGFAGVGHGTYAPLVFAASVAALLPILGLFAGPLLWALYFLLIPDLDRLRNRAIALLLVLLIHVFPFLWVAHGDPAFARADSADLLIFAISVLLTIGSLLFFCIRRSAARI